MTPRQEIQRMRAEVDALAKAAPAVKGKLILLHNAHDVMKLRLRELRVGERATSRDLYEESDGTLRPIRHLHWWCRGFGFKIREDNVRHFRIL